MNKALHLLSLLFCFGLLAPALAPAPAPTLKTLSLEATDGARLAALGGVVPGTTLGIAFLPALGGMKEEWRSTAEAAMRQGYAVILPDLRGQGANVSGPPLSLRSEEYFFMTRDVQAATTWLRSQGIHKLAIVGADLGANLALRVAADDPSIKAAVLLSPGIEYQGVSTRDAVSRYGARPLMNIAGEQDSYAARSAITLDQLAAGPKSLLLIPTSAHGLALLNRDPTLPGSILGFISLYLKS